jgi:molybdate transport system regulatory protein
MTPNKKNAPMPPGPRDPASKNMHHGRIVSIPDQGQCLDSVQLDQLERSFRTWAASSVRKDVRLSRRRILIIFLLIRYTGAKLNEVLAIDPFADLDPERSSVLLHGPDTNTENTTRKVHISRALSREIQEALADASFRDILKNRFDIDPGFVRRKFYERAEACGFSRRMGGPETLRKARGVELMQGNMPLPAVQKMLGHSTPNLTSSYVRFSADDMEQVTRLYMEREASRKTSARNSFFGKIQSIQRGDIQAAVRLATISGQPVTTTITLDSLDRLALKKGRLITAEVKAPWVILQKGDEVPVCSAENRFHGVVERINRGRINTEYAVRMPDETKLCAIVSTVGARALDLNGGDGVWALFNSFAVILHVD